MRFADLFLGVDSLFLHAADLFRVPSVGLFGPTACEEWGFRVTPTWRHISGHGSMDTIQREAVLDALLSIAGAGGSGGRVP
jgi:ADP-heptose:LPS heptosyltransferase